MPMHDDLSLQSSASTEAQARLREVETLFHEASALHPAQRHAFLSTRAADPDMLAELKDLLASDDLVSALMSNPAPQDPWLGRSVGGFQMQSLLGRGGMGVVYLATRTGSGLAQQVAVKLIARHLESTPAQAQFLIERDTLAELSCPHIAHLIDGGFTPEGLPYVVMEYIDGRRLDEVADDPATSLAAIVRLTLQLCEAVSYAHRNLILHRDIKPGNVLVAEPTEGAEGIVKLLDFGTLKGIGSKASRTAADSPMTVAGMRSLTLRYASPEHIRAEPPATTMDVYSLGMTLYRLLAGRLPEVPAPADPADPVDLSIPSFLAHLEATSPAAPSVSMPAARRRADPLLAADLDAIVLKAIRFRAADRYGSADALAADLRRALAKEVVQARAGTLQYRVGSLLRRYRTVALGTAAALLVLVTGVAAMAHQASIARAESRRTEAGVEDERKLAHLLLFDYFEQLKQIPASTDAQRRTVAQALAYVDQLAQSRAVAGTPIESDLIEAYTKMGQVLGSPYEENLGNAPAAITTLSKAVALSQQRLAHTPRDLHALLQASAAQLALGRIYFGNGDPKQALRYLQPAAEESRTIAANPQADAGNIAQAAATIDSLGDLFDLEGEANLQNPAGALAAYQEAALDHRKGLALSSGCARCRRGIAIESWKIGNEFLRTEPAAAIVQYQQGLLAVSSFSPEEQATTRVLRLDNLLRNRLGHADILLGRTNDAILTLRQVQGRFQAAIDQDPIDTRARFDLVALDVDLADAQVAQGKLADALQTGLASLTSTGILVKLDPANRQWQFHYADVLLQTAVTQRMLHHPREAALLESEGKELALQLAQQSDPSAGNLFLAAEAELGWRSPSSIQPIPNAAALCTANSVAPTPELAPLALAQRGIAAATQPDVSQWLTLACAQRSAGNLAESRATAIKVFTMLPPPGRNFVMDALANQAHQLARE